MSLQDFEDLVSKNMGPNKKIVKTDITNLVGGGENFGGELLKLTLTVENETTKETELLHVVAKKIPELEFFQKLFNIQETFRGEITFYEKLVPTFQQFQRQHNVKNVLNCFAEMYGYRLNLNGSDVVDRDAAIILENLTISGYKNLDRYIGFNLDETKLLLKQLAAMHSVPLGIKMKNPELFEKDVKPHLKEKFHPDLEFQDAIILFSEILFESDKCSSAVAKVKRVWKLANDHSNTYKPREPFATLSHSDLWVNNIMIKHENGSPSDVKFVDFQIYNYKSPVIDLLSFLFSSVQTNVLKEDIDNLIKYYHNELIQNLKQLDCNTEPFRFSEFRKELQQDAYLTLCWALTFVTFIIYGPKAQGDERPEGEFDLTSTKARDEIRKSIPYVAKEKLHFLVEYCEHNGWI